MEKAVHITTDRLLLSPLELGEARRLTALLSNWEIVRWMALLPWPYTEQDAEDFIRRVQQENAAGPVTHYAIREKATGLLMGHIDLRPHLAGVIEGAMELGYWLGMPFWGRGYMAEAICGITDYGFKQLGLVCIDAVTHNDNQPSRRALEKAGFRYTGMMPLPYRPNRLRGSDFVHSYQKKREDWQTEQVT